MVRLSISLVISSLVLMGCQQTKMSGAPPKAAPAQGPSAQPAPPPSYNPPPQPPPPQVYNPPPSPPPMPPPANPRYPETEPRDPRPVTPVQPPIRTQPPPMPPINPTNDNIPANPPPQVGVTPTFRPPSIRDPEVVQPPPSQPDPRPNPGTQVVVQPPPRPVQITPPPAPAPAPPPAPARPVTVTPPPPATKLPENPPLPPPRPPETAQKPQTKLPANPPLPPPRPQEVDPCGPQGELCKPVLPVDGQCGPVDLKATEKIEEAKLDVLFVVDTSASLRGGRVGGSGGELAQIASQMEHFVANFPDKTDINIGVMLGHGTGKYVGKLFKTSNSDPAVLSTKEIRNRADLVRRLEQKMKSVPNESKGAQGEALLYSLFQSINKAANRNEIIKQGMFRKDASLAVIMVSDEQDVCFDYSTSIDPETNQPYVPVGKKDAKGNPIPDPIEVAFYKNVCSKAYKGGLLKPGNVHAALMSLKGESQKLILMGIVYTAKNLTPKPGREDENEMGHGIIEFVDLEKGKLVDLGAVQEGPTKFAAELKFLGDYTKSEIAANGNVNCQPKDVHALAVDLNTVKVQLLNGSGQTIGLFNPDCKNKNCGQGKGGMRVDARLSGGKGFLQGFLDAKVLNQLLNAHKAKDAKVLFTFKTRNDRDAKTGAKVDPKTGLPAK